MNALEAVKFDETTTENPAVLTPSAETIEGLNRSLLAKTLDLCAQEHDIFMIRYKGLCETLTNQGATDDQVRKAFTTFKRSMTDFRMALKTIPSKL
jgi:hypothetical protein